MNPRTRTALERMAAQRLDGRSRPVTRAPENVTWELDGEVAGISTPRSTGVSSRQPWVVLSVAAVAALAVLGTIAVSDGDGVAPVPAPATGFAGAPGSPSPSEAPCSPTPAPSPSTRDAGPGDDVGACVEIPVWAVPPYPTYTPGGEVTLRPDPGSPAGAEDLVCLVTGAAGAGLEAIPVPSLPPAAGPVAPATTRSSGYTCTGLYPGQPGPVPIPVCSGSEAFAGGPGLIRLPGSAAPGDFSEACGDGGPVVRLPRAATTPSVH